jgi:hypothetical protein
VDSYSDDKAVKLPIYGPEFNIKIAKLNMVRINDNRLFFKNRFPPETIAFKPSI